MEKYQRPRCGVNLPTPDFAMKELPCATGLTGSFAMDQAQPVPPFVAGGWGMGKRGSVGSGTEPAFREEIKLSA